MWVHNLACQEAQYLDTWSNSDPGIVNMVEALLKMPAPTIAAALGISTSDAQASMEISPKLPTRILLNNKIYNRFIVEQTNSGESVY